MTGDKILLQAFLLFAGFLVFIYLGRLFEVVFDVFTYMYKEIIANQRQRLQAD